MCNKPTCLVKQLFAGCVRLNGEIKHGVERRHFHVDLQEWISVTTAEDTRYGRCTSRPTAADVRSGPVLYAKLMQSQCGVADLNTHFPASEVTTLWCTMFACRMRTLASSPARAKYRSRCRHITQNVNMWWARLALAVVVYVFL